MRPEFTPTVFPFLSRMYSTTEDLAMLAGDPSYKAISILGENKYVANIVKAKQSMAYLGLLFKKVTSLMPTEIRVQLSRDFLSRLEVDLVADESAVQSRQLMTWVGTFYHKMFLGWSKGDCRASAGILIDHVRKYKLDEMLEDTFILGSCPGAEIFYKHFFSVIFHKEAPTELQVQWLEHMMFHITGAAGEPRLAAKIILLMATPSKEDIGHWQFGVQWGDHTEAIPANLAVATSRYSRLVTILAMFRDTRYGRSLPSVLSAMFTLPSPWLPENIGSVLLLLGAGTTSLYIKYLCSACPNCLNKTVTAAIVGISIMTMRFKWTFKNFAFARFDEALTWVPVERREDLVKAVWKGFSTEVGDLRMAAGQGEDWAQEGGKYLYSAIQKMGELMMKKDLCYNQSRDVEP